jgi:hypothetical protein
MIFINVYKFILRAKHTYIHRFYFFSVDYKKHSGLVRKSYSMCKKAPCSLIVATGFKFSLIKFEFIIPITELLKKY